MTPRSPLRLVGILAYCVLLVWPVGSGRAAGPGALAHVEKTPVCVVKVVDANGAPLAGVTVKAFSLERKGFNPIAHRGTLIRAATSPKDGRLSFKIPAGRSLLSVVIVAHKKGLGLDWATWSPHIRGEFTLSPTGGAVLAGRVVDSSGKPVAGAQVCPALTIRGRRINKTYVLPGTPPFDLLVARTDAKGRFRFTDIPKAAMAVLIAVAEGKAKTIARLPNGSVSRFRGGRTDIEIVMPDEAKVSGKVVEKKTGRPVAGLRVTVHAKDYRGMYSRPCFDEVTTGADGEFTIGGLPPGRCTVVTLGPKTGLGDWILASFETETKAGQTTGGVKLELVPGGVLAVSVVDAHGGAPIAGAYPWILGRMAGAVLVESGHDGVTRARLMPGKYAVFAVGKFGYQAYQTREKVTIVAGQTQKLRARLRRYSMLRGVVLDPAGKPVSGVEITSMPSYLEASGYRYAIRTQEEGRFAIFLQNRHIPRLVPVPEAFRRPPDRIVARLPSRNLVAAVKIGNSKTVEVKLTVGARITGRVVDPAGRPIAGAAVLASSVKCSPSGRPFAVTGATGRYEFQALLPGFPCVVTVTAHGYGRGKVKVDLPEKPRAPTRIEKIVLKPANLSISGVVLDPDGEPAVGVRVYADGEDQPESIPVVKTDKKGKFKIDKLCRGEVRLSASGKGASQGSTQAAVGKTDIEVQLEPPPWTPWPPKPPPTVSETEDF